MTYAHMTDNELMARVIMNGEGDALSRELALRLEAKTDELETVEAELFQLKQSIANEVLFCPECGTSI